MSTIPQSDWIELLAACGSYDEQRKGAGTKTTRVLRTRRNGVRL